LEKVWNEINFKWYWGSFTDQKLLFERRDHCRARIGDKEKEKR